VSISEYVASFFLVIIGFAVSEVLKGTARLIGERRYIQFYWPYFLAIPFLFEVLIINFFWLFTFVQEKEGTPWSMADITFVTFLVAPLAFTSYLIFPTRIGEGFDLKRFYFENGRIIVVVGVAQMLAVDVWMAFDGDWVAVALQSTGMVVAALVLLKFEKVHKVALIALIIVVIALVFVKGAGSING
jgi:hypothetical protein